MVAVPASPFVMSTRSAATHGLGFDGHELASSSSPASSHGGHGACSSLWRSSASMGARPREDSPHAALSSSIAHSTKAELRLSSCSYSTGMVDMLARRRLPSLAHPPSHSMLPFKLIVMMSSATAYSQQGAEIGGTLSISIAPSSASSMLGRSSF
ncbi:hypothetical protein Dimus_024486 [Dionaea muscipula]